MPAHAPSPLRAAPPSPSAKSPRRPPPCRAGAGQAGPSLHAGQSPSPSPRLNLDSRVLRSQLAALSADLAAYEPSNDFAGGSDAAARGSIAVEFRITFQTRPGQEICLVGSSPRLGEWSVANALALTWTAGGVWTASVSLGCGDIVFYKFFLKENGYLKEWQGGNNVMLVLPTSAAELPAGVLVAESAWTGSPTATVAASEARVQARLTAADTITAAAEAAAQAAGLVAQTVMTELLTAREETAVALRFISEKGLANEFEGLRDGIAAPHSVLPAGRKTRKAPASRGARSEEELDAEIAATLQAQLSGALDLSDGRALAGDGRVDLSGGSVWEEGFTRSR